MKKLAIIGSGDLGFQIAYHAKFDGNFEIAGFFDDFETPGNIKHGHSILGKTDDIEEAFKKGKFDCLLVAIGYKHLQFRHRIFERFYRKIPFANLIHSSSYVDPSCILGEGVVIYPGCTLDMNCRIGNNVLLNAGCVIAHDSEIGSHCFLSPAVNVAGFVKVEPLVNLGIGTVVIDNINIKSQVRTGAGAVVINNLDTPGLYVGIPAEFKKS